MDDTVGITALIADLAQTGLYMSTLPSELFVSAREFELLRRRKGVSQREKFEFLARFLSSRAKTWTPNGSVR